MKLPIIIASAVSLVSCAPNIAPPAAPGTVDHVVLIWLKRPNHVADQMAIKAATDDLRTIPGIKFLDVGTALQSDRPVVDDSFDIGLTMRFDSEKSLLDYEKDPLHVKKVTETLKPLSRKIVVYDIVR